MELVGGPDQAERVREVAELLVALREHGGDDAEHRGGDHFGVSGADRPGAAGTG
ncbi:hypothetical protein GCM10009827_004790 [Dactylosporangium maewongense]|uniref:Uncharacterized protein n=1 Tax=Dactylosporangium maewongense TaxID=634393 RepID=A0ABN1ZJG2_9ACTN